MAFLTFISTRAQAATEAEEKKYRIIRELLLKMGIKGLEPILPIDPNQFSREMKAKFRPLLARYAVTIEDDRQGGTSIYLEQEKVFNWEKPRYIFRVENKQLMVEVQLYYWSIFEG